MAKHITIKPAEGTWVVRAGGAVLGESDNALELTESGYPPVIYFPREDIAMEFLDASEKKTECPYKVSGFEGQVTRNLRDSLFRVLIAQD